MKGKMEALSTGEENKNEHRKIEVETETNVCSSCDNRECKEADAWFLAFGTSMVLCHFLGIQIFTELFFNTIDSILLVILMYTASRFVKNFSRSYSWLEMIVETMFLVIHVIIVAAWKGYIDKEIISWKAPEIALTAMNSMIHLISVAQRLAGRPELEYNRYNTIAYIPIIFMTCVTVLVWITGVGMNYVSYAYILSSTILGIISLGSKDSVEKESSDNSNRYKMISSLCMGGLITVSMIIATKELEIIKFAKE